MPKNFACAAAFRAWLSRWHASRTELLVRIRKAGSRTPGLSYKEALDEALCFGWIDGVRTRIDDESFSIRFSPRKPRSIWSRVNVAKAEALAAAGRMAEPGLAAFRARTASRTGLYSFERAAMSLTPAFEKTFRRRRGAWAWFSKQAPWYRRVSVFWVMSAKMEETRERRLATLIDCSERGVPIGLLKRKP